jgi:hypothetical protein
VLVKALIKSINPWVAVFVFLVFFHGLRGSYLDATVFAIASALLLLEQAGKFKKLHASKPEVPRFLIVGILILTAAVLYLSPRHSLLDGILMLLLLPGALYLVWYPDRGRKPNGSMPIRRAKFVWFYLILAMSLIELYAFFMSAIIDNDYVYPTISIVLDGPLDTGIGRAVWVTIWALSGVGLLRIWRRKK